MKHKPEKIEEAKKLRLEGLSYEKIAKQISVSSMTIKRWNKRGYLKGVSNKDTENKPDATGNTENVENKELNNGNKDVEGNIGNKESIGNSFHSSNVTFDTKTGGFTLEPGDKKIVMPETIKPIMPETTKETVKPGGGQGQQIAHVTEHRDIDEPENVMDKFFSRGMIETLVPVGILLAGYMMKGKLGEKGEFREQAEGGNW